MTHDSIGIVVLLLVILMPVYVTLGGWLFADRDLRTAFIGMAYMGTIAVAMITATAALGAAFWVIANLPL